MKCICGGYHGLICPIHGNGAEEEQINLGIYRGSVESLMERILDEIVIACRDNLKLREQLLSKLSDFGYKGIPL